MTRSFDGWQGRGSAYPERNLPGQSYRSHAVDRDVVNASGTFSQSTASLLPFAPHSWATCTTQHIAHLWRLCIFTLSCFANGHISRIRLSVRLCV